MIISKSTQDYLKAKELVTRSLPLEHLEVHVPILISHGTKETAQTYFRGFMQLTLRTIAEADKAVILENLQSPLNKSTSAFNLKCQSPSGRCKTVFSPTSARK